MFVRFIIERSPFFPWAGWLRECVLIGLRYTYVGQVVVQIEICLETPGRLIDFALFPFLHQDFHLISLDTD